MKNMELTPKFEIFSEIYRTFVAKMEIFTDEVDWTSSTNSNTKGKHNKKKRGASGGHIAFLNFEGATNSPMPNNGMRQALSPSSNHSNIQTRNGDNMRKQAMKKAASNAMPPPPTRRPSRAPPVPPAAKPPTTAAPTHDNDNNKKTTFTSSTTSTTSTTNSSTTTSSPQIDATLNTSKRAAESSEQSGQKPTKRRRVGTVTKNNLGETVERASLASDQDEEPIAMEVEIPTPVPIRTAKEKQNDEEAEIRQRAEQYKQRGNEKYTNGLYDQARALYTKASELVHNTSPVYLCNRSACGLMLGEFEKALEDAMSAIAIDHTHARALERAGRASLSLGRGKDCCKYMQKAIEATRVQNNANSQIKIEQLKVEIGKADTYEHALSRAERAIKRHDGAGATKVLSDALTISPGAAEAKLLLAVATIVNGNWSGIVDATSNQTNPVTLGKIFFKIYLYSKHF